MTKAWNFRTILSIDPVTETHCVAYNRSGRRCGNARYWVGAKNWAKAGQILDEMDCMESMSDCRDELHNLVKVMVCGSPHRTHQGALDECVGRWNKAIDSYVALRRREKVAIEVVSPTGMGMTGDVVIGGGKNESLPFSYVGAALQLQQLPALKNSNSIPILTRVSRSGDLGPIRVNAPADPRLALETRTNDDWLARSENTAVSDNLPLDQSSKHDTGVESQCKEQDWNLGLYNDLPQQDEDLGRKLETEMTPTPPAYDSIRTLPKLNIEATVFSDKEEVSPLESDYEPEESVLSVSPSHSVSGSLQNERKVNVDEYQQTSQSKPGYEGAEMLPNMSNTSQDLLKRSESDEGMMARSNSDVSEPIDRRASNSNPLISSDLTFSLGEESTSSSPEDTIAAFPGDDEYALTPGTEVSSTKEDLQETQKSHIPTEVEREPILPKNIDVDSTLSPIVAPAAEQPSLENIDLTQFTSSEEIDIVVVKGHIPVKKRQTCSTNEKLLQVRSDSDHLSPIQSEPYGTITVHPTETRSPQRFLDSRTSSQPEPASKPFTVDFDRREALAPLATNKKIIVKKEVVQQARRSSVIENVVKDEIQWENDRGVVEKKKGLRTSLSGVVQKAWTRGKRGLRQSGS